MLEHVWNRKVARLPDEGVMLVCTDLQGNLGDFERMVALYREAAAEGPAVLAFCGDLVHGPSPELLEPGAWPRHLGTPYADESAELLRRFEALCREEAMFSVLGNHEHAHIGGPRVPKFYPDEAAVLNRALGSDRERLCDFLRTFPLVAVAPCGVVLTHASPRVTAPSIEAFEALEWAGYEHVHVLEMAYRDALGALLWARGCSDPDAQALLKVVTGEAIGVVVHGHDVVRAGFAREGRHHMVLSTSFALMDERKTYLRVDLGGKYSSTADLREGVELCALYPEAAQLPEMAPSAGTG